MEENTQLPKDSIIPADKIAFMKEAIEKLRKANRSDYESGDFDAYNHTNAGRYKAFEEVLQWVNPITSYEEKIKVLTYDNNRLKGEVEGLNRWKEEAKAIINPIWEYADALKVPLGESKTEAVIKHAKELEHQNDKMKATATGWRPLLEEVLKHDAAFGELSIEIIDKIKKFLYGE